MLIDRLERWLCLNHPYLTGITREAMMTFVAIITLLGTIAALRRRDHGLSLLFGGLLLMFLAYPLRLAIILRAQKFTVATTPIMAYVEAMHPSYVLGAISANFLQPIGCLFGLWGAIITLRRSCDRQEQQSSPDSAVS